MAPIFLCFAIYLNSIKMYQNRIARLHEQVAHPIHFSVARFHYTPSSSQRFARVHKTKRKDGKTHVDCAPAYDDWMRNGDSIFWNDVLGYAFGLSSMSIRVDEGALTHSAKFKRVSGTKKRLQIAKKWVLLYCRTMPLELVSKKEGL